jgi:hypothetical protein
VIRGNIIISGDSDCDSNLALLLLAIFMTFRAKLIVFFTVVWLLVMMDLVNLVKGVFLLSFQQPQ